MSRVSPSKSILEWAVHRRGLSNHRVRALFPKFGEWLSGETKPTLKQLEAFAKATSTPFGYLFLDTPPVDQLPIPHFRTLQDKEVYEPSVELLDTVRQMQQRQDWLREYLQREGYDALTFVGSYKGSNNVKNVAANMRSMLGLSFDWASKYRTWSEALTNLRNAMESLGIYVFANGVVGNNTHRALSPQEFRGFVLVDRYAPVVFVNGADGKAAQMFTLAHELAHVFLGSSASFDLGNLQPADDPTERACNQLAAEFLVPENEMRSAWTSLRRGQEPFQTLANRFKVSAIVVARRALDLDLIKKDDFFAFYNSYIRELKQKKENDQSGGGDFYATQGLRVGKRFGEVVSRAVKEGKLLYSDAYRLTGLQGTAFKKFTSLQGHGEPGE